MKYEVDVIEGNLESGNDATNMHDERPDVDEQNDLDVHEKANHDVQRQIPDARHDVEELRDQRDEMDQQINEMEQRCSSASLSAILLLAKLSQSKEASPDMSKKSI